MGKKVLADYDEMSDVLYLSVGQPDRHARSFEDETGLIWRQSPDGEWTGVTIPDFKYFWTRREDELARLLSARLPTSVQALTDAH